MHGSGHLVKSEYTLPETGSGSVGGAGPGEAGSGGPTHILPDTSGQSLPPLMHMGYAVGRHAQVMLLSDALVLMYKVRRVLDSSTSRVFL